jgi:hypothetical protein
VSIGAQAATLPLVIARFGVYYPSGLIASLILVPLTTAFLWAGLAWLAIFAVPWPWLHDLCSHAFAGLYAAIETSARVLSRLPGIGFPPGFVPWAVGASFAALLCLGTVLPARIHSPLSKLPLAGDGR